MRRRSIQRSGPTDIHREAEFVRWLHADTDTVILAAEPGPIAARYGLDRREVECKLLARQASIRRAQSQFQEKIIG